MHIIPVIDIMRGVVVRGVAGRRDEYRPIVSQLTVEPTPSAVAQAFRQRGFDTVYVADLDAITGHGVQSSALEAIADAGLQMWVDAGGMSLGDGFASPHSLVIGTETLASPQALSDALQQHGHDRVVFSLDLKQQQPLAIYQPWQSLSPLEIAKQAIALGVRRMIVLDLAQVGIGQGTGTEDLCRAIYLHAPQVQIIAGGGVRNRADLDRLAAAGCSAALVASALHDGLLSNF
jgi:phosphoribosylformimino-5-aminoimidazole carboxamide ribotide isomerase